MEAPEKIYIDDPTGEFNDHWSIYQNNDSIEYIRADAFIEKAEKAMIEWAGTYILKTTGGGVRERMALATDLLNYFEKYIRGE